MNIGAGTKRYSLLVPSANALHGWKQIASALDVGVRTAQRWHAIAGLPVHRLSLGTRGTVFARRDELDAWREQHSVLTASGRRADSTATEPTLSDLRSPHVVRNLVRAAAAFLALR